MVNVLSGGLHGGHNIDFQDFLVIPLRARRYREALADIFAIYRTMKVTLQSRGFYTAGVADEGGYAPKLPSNEIGFELLVEAIERAGLRPGVDAAIAVDVAASHWWSGSHYSLKTEGVEISPVELQERIQKWLSSYPILSIEDGLAEEDWTGWRTLTEQVGNQCQLIGDDLFATNPGRVRKGIDSGVANAILVKMNQVGTLTETLQVIAIAKQHGYLTVVSARSGETEDDTMADQAVATCASQIKIGSITRSERLAKYNRLLRIEEELGEGAIYRGPDVFAKWIV
jgi:enolase